jgi:hypothetical protein
MAELAIAPIIETLDHLAIRIADEQEKSRWCAEPPRQEGRARQDALNAVVAWRAACGWRRSNGGGRSSDLTARSARTRV